MRNTGEGTYQFFSVTQNRSDFQLLDIEQSLSIEVPQPEILEIMHSIAILVASIIIVWFNLNKPLEIYNFYF